MDAREWQSSVLASSLSEYESETYGRIPRKALPFRRESSLNILPNILNVATKSLFL